MKNLRAKWVLATRPRGRPPKPVERVQRQADPMKHSAHQTALRHARKDRVTEQDIPHLFRWLSPALSSEGERGPQGQYPAGEPPSELTWEGLKQSIHDRLKTEHQTGRTVGRMRQDTKRLAKIESVTQKLVEALELGASLDIAAAYAGIRPAEFREWLALGHSKPRSVYAAFLTLIQEAVAKCDVKDLQVVTKAAGSGEWKAAIERLKLRGFGSQNAPEKKPVQVKIVNYNFAAPSQKAIAQTIDYDTLEPVQEESRAITAREEPEGDLGECEDADARRSSSEAGRGHLVLEEPEGETSPETREKEVAHGRSD